MGSAGSGVGARPEQEGKGLGAAAPKDIGDQRRASYLFAGMGSSKRLFARNSLTGFIILVRIPGKQGGDTQLSQFYLVIMS